MIENEANVLPVVNTIVVGKEDWYFLNRSKKNTQRIYNKDVYLRDARIEIPYLIEGVQLTDMIVNILDKDVLPNLSRKEISRIDSKKIGYAIGKAIHISILKTLEGGTKELFEAFINQFYSTSSKYIE